MTVTAPIPLRPDAPAPDVPVYRYLGFLLGPGVRSYAFNSASLTTPQLSSEFGASATMISLVIAGYGIPFAVLLILGGRLGDRYGRHRLFAFGMMVLFVMAIACSIAPTIELLVVARVLQGVGAALCTPQVLATIQATSTGVARVKAIAAFGASRGIGGALGQVLGGTLAGMQFGALSGWRLTYWLAAIVAVAAVILSRMAPRSSAHEAVDIDVAGTLLLAAGIFLLSAAFTFGRPFGWSWPVVAALIAGVIALTLLWRHQNRIESTGRVPLLPPSVLRLPALILGLVICGLFFAGCGMLLFVLPRVLEHDLGVSPAGAGLVLLPFALVFTVVSLSLVPIQRLLGERTLLAGVTLQAVALAALGVTVWVGWSVDLVWTMQPALVILGVSQALIFGPLAQDVIRSIPAEAAGLSGGLFSTVQQLALSLGVIAIGAIIATTQWTGRIELTAGIVVNLILVIVGIALAAALMRMRETPAGR